MVYSCSNLGVTDVTVMSPDLGVLSGLEWSLKRLSRDMLEASALLIVVQGGEHHTNSTRFGSILAALQMRRSNINEQGSLSKISECIKVTEVHLVTFLIPLHSPR